MLNFTRHAEYRDHPSGQKGLHIRIISWIAVFAKYFVKLSSFHTLQTNVTSFAGLCLASPWSAGGCSTRVKATDPRATITTLKAQQPEDRPISTKPCKSPTRDQFSVTWPLMICLSWFLRGHYLLKHSRITKGQNTVRWGSAFLKKTWQKTEYRFTC